MCVAIRLADQLFYQLAILLTAGWNDCKRILLTWLALLMMYSRLQTGWLLCYLNDWLPVWANECPPDYLTACLNIKLAAWLRAPPRSAQTLKWKQPNSDKWGAGWNDQREKSSEMWERRGERDGLREELPCLACCCTLGNISLTFSLSIYIFMSADAHKHTQMEIHFKVFPLLLYLWIELNLSPRHRKPKSTTLKPSQYFR